MAGAAGWRSRRLRAHCEHCRGDVVGLGVAQRPTVEQEASLTDDSDDRRVVEAERRRERLLDGAGEARDLRERERAAADAPDRLLELSADARRQPLGTL